MGLLDNYPPEFDLIDRERLEEIEERCIGWRWKIKGKTYRLCQVHGDFHPWNVIFRESTDFTVLDRSRGEWGEPADDVSAMTINYIFFSLQRYGSLAGPFKEFFMDFWENYLTKTSDQEIFSVIAPFYAWRGLMIASPIWYPDLSREIRRKLFNFIFSVLKEEKFQVDAVNDYLS